MMKRSSVRRLAAIGIGAALTIATAAPARAQSFISPLVGFNFGGDATCPAIRDCENKRLDFGASLGRMGNLFGVEEELAYTKDFFGSAPTLTSNVLTLMTNVMLVPNIGPVRPYALAGIGLMRTHTEVTPGTGEHNDSNLGWDVGGGLMILFAPHVGVRGDVRYFHAFKDLEFLGFSLSDTKLDFGRASGALVFTF